MGRRGAACSGARRMGRQLLAAAAMAALAWPTGSVAVRVSDVPRFATLSRPMTGRLGRSACAVPEGSTVELVAEVAGPGVEPTAQRRWFVRVVDGACQGAELNLPQDCLRDERDTPAPSARSPSAPR